MEEMSLRQKIGLISSKKKYIGLSISEIARGFILVFGQSQAVIYIVKGISQNNPVIFLQGSIILGSTLLFSTSCVFLIEFFCDRILFDTKTDIRTKLFQIKLLNRIEDKNEKKLQYLSNENLDEIIIFYENLKFFIGSFGKTLGSLFVGFSISIQLSLIMLSLGVLKIIVEKRLIIPLKEIKEEIKKQNLRLNGSLFDFLKTIDLCRYYCDVKTIKEIKKTMDKIQQSSKNDAKVSAAMIIWQNIFEIISLIIVIFLGFEFVKTEQLMISQFVAFVTLHNSLINPYKFIGNFITENEKANPAFDLFQKESALNKVHEKRINTSNTGLDKKRKFLLVLSNITFQYKNEKSPLLKELYYQAESGKINYICGKSGQGKTTLFKLIGNLEKPQQGEVYLTYPEQTERIKVILEYISYVGQKVFLFDGTLKHNIAMELNPKLEKVKDSLHKAGLGYLLSRYMDDLDHEFKNINKELSEGEKNRLALARVFYCNRPILLLDEVFSSLDNKNILSIQDYFEEMLHDNCCILLITHRTEWIGKNSNVLYLE